MGCGITECKAIIIPIDFEDQGIIDIGSESVEGVRNGVFE